ncbi:HNH endonuclease [Corynebacterium sp. 320]|uniref:HNH endonuclease family protein n=1 Tax=Corynebacterium TaxID=1716 RepID=UPI00125CBBD3|nr:MULTISPECIES: HNH endonuclease family protein [Corynebacterium]KAB1503955.1 HNH endonuclease [Corynebacterium sp. 320]KAB1552946.1 HNH endonuclease [Corynebacterium sp. 321]KAB1553834.1 HNH endonuclease [Corynebacterium sp. 319]KAB3528091.1 HNH endonuclease [Corynebacterium sp. 250]KAB3540421.1 HNH endonuclease [Corynebacterium sp. 366]
MWRFLSVFIRRARLFCVHFSPARGFLAACTATSLLLLFLPQRTPPAPPELAASLTHDLSTLTVIAVRPKVLGYDRDQFGHGWAHSLNQHTGQLCTTREAVLQDTFALHDCRDRRELGVAHPQLDPYTGRAMDPTHVDIDHIVPLSAAWDLGAWSWTSQRRRDFANDAQLNLVAVDSTINRTKSDATLSAWMPPDPRQHCAYAARYIHVSAVYGLAITRADERTARAACGL